MEIINAFVSLGKDINDNINNEDYQKVINKAQAKNPWFTRQNIQTALLNLTLWFKEDTLKGFCNKYTLNEKQKTVAIICAGNIPLVAFHDIFCTLLSLNKAMVKLSSNDDVLIPFLVSRVKEIRERVVFVDRIHDYDAVIATGSNNTSRYFSKYFSNVPNIIRQSRYSVAVIQQDDDISLLKDDIFLYFGLGCRNVSCMFVPKGFDFNKLSCCFASYSNVLDNNKYKNNYDYNKAIFIMNNVPFIDLGNILLKESDDLFSSVAVLNYSYYDDIKQVKEVLKQNKDSLQCVVSSFQDSCLPVVPFGSSQKPLVDTFADNVDTMLFLSNLK